MVFMDEDRYPSQAGRRRFVKGVVASAALAGVGAGGASAVDFATRPQGGGGGVTPFVGIEQTDGPAPRGMPYIPVEIDDDGDIRGVWPDVEEVTEQGRTYEVARMEIGGRTYSSEWFQYCGRQQADGVRPSADQGDHFLSVDSPSYEWQAAELEAGDRLNLGHFEDYETWGNDVGDAGVGKPAEATWRSEGEGQLPVTVIRSPIIEEKAQRDDETGEWYAAASQEGVIAFLNVCTHFCCVPKGYKISGDATNYSAENGVYCQCHQSTYDPFTPEFGQFIALPRPEDSGSDEEGHEADASVLFVVGYEDEQVFNPDDLTIEIGTTVKFVWEEGGHTVVVVDRPDGANWDGVSKPQEEGHAHEHTFDTAGEYVLECDRHPDEESDASILVRDDLE